MLGGIRMYPRTRGYSNYRLPRHLGRGEKGNCVKS